MMMIRPACERVTIAFNRMFKWRGGMGACEMRSIRTKNGEQTNFIEHESLNVLTLLAQQIRLQGFQ